MISTSRYHVPCHAICRESRRESECAPSPGKCLASIRRAAPQESRSAEKIALYIQTLEGCFASLEAQAAAMSGQRSFQSFLASDFDIHELHLLTSVTLSNQCQLSCSCDRAKLYSREGYSATLAVRDAAPFTVSLKLRPPRTGPGDWLSDGIPEDTLCSLPTPGDVLPSSM